MKRFGFKKRNKLSVEQAGQQISPLRLAAKQEADRNRTQPGSHGDQHPNADPSRMVGRTNNAPNCLANLDYTDLEDELRCAVHGPSAEFGTVTPQEEYEGVVISTEVVPTGDDPLLKESQRLMTSVLDNRDLKFLRDHSPHLSTYVSAFVMHDLRKGVTDARQSVRKALLLAADQGVTPLRTEARNLMAEETRVGSVLLPSPSGNHVIFFSPQEDWDSGGHANDVERVHLRSV